MDLSLSENPVEKDFDAVRWSCQPFDKKRLEAFFAWLQDAKTKNSDIIDALIFRAPKERLPYESQREGLLFAGLQDGSLSPENIRDIGIYLSTLDIQDPEEVDTNGDTSAKRSVSLPGLTQSWDSVVQTSSSLFSALTFGTLPAKRSPLAASVDSQDVALKPHPKTPDVGRWIIGGGKEGMRIWLEAGSEKLVPISLGNSRPGFLRELSGQQSPDEDSLVEVELSVYKVNLHFLC